MRRAFGANWWAQKWIEALEAIGWEGRLQRGRSYARTGQVRSIDVQPGRVAARVKGSRPQPYVVRMELPTLSDETWERVIAALGGQARYAAMLLAGEMPPDIESVFVDQGAHLFPRSEQELQTECSCPDFMNPCKHIAAVHYILGGELDRDPFLLFRLRGRTREAVLGALRALRTEPGGPGADAASSEESGPAQSPLPVEPEQFWPLGAEVGALRFSIEGPRVPEAVLRRLGNPLALQEGDLAQAELLRFYRTISDRAIRTAYDTP
jgi:uncharacterized Zn finger protein